MDLSGYTKQIVLNMRGVLNRHTLFFVVMWFLTILLYGYIYDAGFYRDINGLYLDYERMSFREFCLEERAYRQGLYIVTHIITYFLFSLFQINTWCWFFLFTGLHALVGILFLQFAQQLLDCFLFRKSRMIAVLATLLFIISPLHVEILTWRSCLHYFIATIGVLLILRLLLNYYNNGNKISILFILLIQILMLFMLELHYLIPFFIFILSVSFYWANLISRERFRQVMSYMLLPSFVLLGGYFVLKKSIQNYSEIEVESRITVEQIGINTQHDEKLKKLFSKSIKYPMRIYTMEQFLPNNIKKKYYDFLHQTWVIGIAILSLSCISLLGIWKYSKMQARSQLLFVLFFLTILSSAISLPLHFNEVNAFEYQRYYYLPALFAFLFLCSWLFTSKMFLFPRLIYSIVAIAYFVGVQMLVRDVRIATDIQHHLVRTFPFMEQDTVVVLSLPENYKGVTIIDGNPDEEIKIYQDLYGLDVMKGKNYNVANHNLYTLKDGINIDVLSSQHLRIKVTNLSTQWFYSGYKPQNYSNELFKVVFSPDYKYYDLFFHNPIAESTALVYYQHPEWKKLEFIQ